MKPTIKNNQIICWVNEDGEEVLCFPLTEETKRAIADHPDEDLETLLLKLGFRWVNGWLKEGEND